MTITVTGVKKEVADGMTLAQLVVDEKVETPEYVTAISSSSFEDTVLKDGDNVEFIYFMGGGQ